MVSGSVIAAYVLNIKPQSVGVVLNTALLVTRRINK
jgi:hypothetical protein